MPYANGETILAEGDTTNAFFYIVKRGHVAISKELAPSRSISKEAAPAAALPSATQGGGLGASQVSESKVSELAPRVSERLALATLGRGEFFGEMALLPGEVPGKVRARGATVRACGHAVCLRLHKSDFDRVIAPLAALREEMAARQEDNSTREEVSNY